MKSAAPGPCQPEQEKKPPKPRGIDLIWGLKIPMRDGVKLNATLYKPKKMDDPLPVIFTLTPYISDSYHERAYYFSQNGYVFALVDSRGRGNSEGEFQPNLQEALDGHDIVEWLAGQSWCSGKVTMWGGSYGGYNQWVTLKEFPPHLQTIVPVASGHPGVDFPFWRNIFYPYDMQWLTLTSGVTANSKLFEQSSFWIQKYRELYDAHLPFKKLNKIVGNPSATFQTWVSHPKQGPFGDAMNPSDEQFAKMNLPILTITGHYDGDQPGAMGFYKLHIRHASPEARSKHYLIIGPWDHAGTRTPKEEFGGLKFGKASLLDMNKLHKEWYDWTMKDGKKPEFLKKQVAYYLAGAEKWKYVDDLESIAPASRKLYLKSNGRANDVFHSGQLTEENPQASSPDRYVYDPLDTRPAELEKEEVKNWITDQRYALNLFGSGLVYHSQPFPDDTEITGYLKLVAWMAMDVPDTDFVVLIYEIKPDGTSILLTQDMMRARYRESLRQEKLVKPGEINRYEFGGFFFFSRQIAKESRLRLVIRAPNSIYWQKNYNSGGEVAAESGKDACTAHITLYHDAEHPSYLEIPIVE
jgi:putative CocE/NonD family hydrolase